MAHTKSPYNVESLTPVMENGILSWEATFGDGVVIRLGEIDLMEAARRKRYPLGLPPEKTQE
jgi:hypothetical protein